MDPSLMPSFRAVLAAIDGIGIVCHVNVTVLDRMNLCGVHNMAVQFVAVWNTVLNRSNNLNSNAIMSIISIKNIMQLMSII